MLRSLVGSEMCIRDSQHCCPRLHQHIPHRHRGPHCQHHLPQRLCDRPPQRHRQAYPLTHRLPLHTHTCLLYTSDAADEEDSVDLGGRRIIKKKKKIKYNDHYIL
eukprot:TRINITY_DN10182_c0_g2_i4.p1 TRINITY_DN10182_c0_g2~~TRINITY_DN10182_c0_g2_i4.p1  ORF type:complete len:105 (-),score=23.04 TRINITY_DN10182_c0_g2_i4:63-377(-)